MRQYMQQSVGEHSEAAGPSRLAGILPEAYGTETEAIRSNFFQTLYLHLFLGGALLSAQTQRIDQTSAPIEAAGVGVHSAIS